MAVLKDGWRHWINCRHTVSAATLLMVAVAAGCGGPPPRTPDRPEAFQEVKARRQIFRGFQGQGSLALKHKADKLTIPVEVTVTGDLVLEARGEVSHFLLPFEGEVRLVCDEDATLLHTNVGTYNIATAPDAQPAARAFLLSLAGGGDWLLWWLAESGCDIGEKTLCGGLEIELEPHPRLPSIGGWEVNDTREGTAFKATVDEYQPGSVIPRTVSGIITPYEIMIYLEYNEVSVPPGPAG